MQHCSSITAREPLAFVVLVQGKQLLYAQQEERDQLRRAGYNPILWGVADRAREVFSDVPQAWYQRLLELGNLQVRAPGDGCWYKMPELYQMLPELWHLRMKAVGQGEPRAVPDAGIPHCLPGLQLGCSGAWGAAWMPGSLQRLLSPCMPCLQERAALAVKACSCMRPQPFRVSGMHSILSNSSLEVPRHSIRLTPVCSHSLSALAACSSYK